MISKQGVVVGAHPSGDWMAGSCFVEHPADSWAVDGILMNAESDDAACVLVEDDEDPMGLEDDGLAPE